MIFDILILSFVALVALIAADARPEKGADRPHLSVRIARVPKITGRTDARD